MLHRYTIGLFLCLSLFCLLLTAGFTGCNSKTADSNPETSNTPAQSADDTFSTKTRDAPSYQPVPNPLDHPERLQSQISEADISILFIGNSHSVLIPRVMKSINETVSPDLNLFTLRARRRSFLNAHAKNPDTRRLIGAGNWDYVVLQAQKYSTSGKYTYPTDGAVNLAQLAIEQGSTVILFPEWSRRGFPDEYLRINSLHDEIATKTGAYVAPIGQVWDAATKQFPQLVFLDKDGNHAAHAGNFLTAAIFYSLVVGKNPELAGEDQATRELATFTWNWIEENYWTGENHVLDNRPFSQGNRPTNGREADGPQRNGSSSDSSKE